MNKTAAGYALAIGGLVAAAGITWIILTSQTSVAKPASKFAGEDLLSGATGVETIIGQIGPAVIVRP